MNRSKAVILFTDNPSSDAKRKSKNVAHKRVLEEHYNNYISSVQQEIRESDLELIISTPDKTFNAPECQFIHCQLEDSFANRFYSAFQYAFQLAFEKVAIIGNDSLSLKMSQIEFAIDESDKGNISIGPSLDGGFYILSLHRNDFGKIDLNKLQSLPFETNKIFTELVDLLCSSGLELTTLAPKIDVDDFNSFVISCNYSELLHFVEEIIKLTLLQIANKYNPHLFNYTRSQNYLIHTLKAPPRF
jgi:hypothetical protein